MSSKVVQLKMSGGDRVLYSASVDGFVKLWAMPTFQPIKTIQIGPPVIKLASSRNNKTLIVMAEDAEGGSMGEDDGVEEGEEEEGVEEGDDEGVEEGDDEGSVSSPVLPSNVHIFKIN